MKGDPRTRIAQIINEATEKLVHISTWDALLDAHTCENVTVGAAGAQLASSDVLVDLALACTAKMTPDRVNLRLCQALHCYFMTAPHFQMWGASDKIVTSSSDYVSRECKKVRDDLIALDPGMTGRVPLWRFSDSDDCLRQLGVAQRLPTATGDKT